MIVYGRGADLLSPSVFRQSPVGHSSETPNGYAGAGEDKL